MESRAITIESGTLKNYLFRVRFVDEEQTALHAWVLTLRVRASESLATSGLYNECVHNSKTNLDFFSRELSSRFLLLLSKANQNKTKVFDIHAQGANRTNCLQSTGVAKMFTKPAGTGIGAISKFKTATSVSCLRLTALRQAYLGMELPSMLSRLLVKNGPVREEIGTARERRDRRSSCTV